MKTTSTPSETRKIRALILLGTLAAAITTVACSRHSEPALSSTSNAANLRPAAFQTVAAEASDSVPLTSVKQTTTKPPAAKSGMFRSRDYGVSFEYPWQYAFVSARAIANGSESLKPTPDGHDGQFALARVDIPKGFYADTNYDSGYFTLSLNQDLNQEQCSALLEKDGKVDEQTINGVDFRWIDTDEGGRGSATRLRRYVTYANATCYEVEMGVKTRNQDGLARDVDPDQVMRRLEAILRTVKIVPEKTKPASKVVENTTDAASPVQEKPAPQN